MPNALPALERTIQVMHAIAEGHEATSLGLARHLGISQSTCYRILETLEQAHWIERGEDQQVRFSTGLLPFVKPLMGVELAVAALQPILEHLAATTGVSAKLSMRQGAEQLTMARAEPPQPITLSSPVGARFPVVLGASGASLLCGASTSDIEQLIDQTSADGVWDDDSPKALRKRVAECRRKGYCQNIGHSRRGIDTLSAPLRHNELCLAITLVGLRGDLDPPHDRRARKALREAVSQAEAALPTPSPMERTS